MRHLNDCAFPQPAGTATGKLDDTEFPVRERGMTMLEYYVGKALQGLLSGTAPDVLWPRPEIVAKLAVAYADACIAELNQKVGK